MVPYIMVNGSTANRMATVKKDMTTALFTWDNLSKVRGKAGGL